MTGQQRSSDNDLGRFGEKDEVLNVRAEMMKRRGLVGGLIDDIGRRLSHPPFFIALLLVNLLWIVPNT